jgi:hypothetical protein
LLSNVWVHPVEQAGEDAGRWRLPPSLRGPPWPPLEHFAVLRIQHS